jgi:hypothetical protein
MTVCHDLEKGGIIDMAGKKSPEVPNFATMSFVWGVIALAAFFALPWVANSKGGGYTTGFAFALNVANSGIGAIHGVKAASLADPLSLLYFVLILLIPVAALGTAVTGIFMRVRVPEKNNLIVLSFLSVIVGLAGTLVMFIPNVAENATTQRQFEVAGIVVLISAVLSQIQKPIQNLFKANPTITSLLLVGFAYGSLVLANSVSFIQIIVQQAGIWLGLLSFMIALYSGTRIYRLVRAARKGK